MPETVYLRELLESPEMKGNTGSLPIALGRDADGRFIIQDMARMPHMIIAGQASSGKTVCVHSIIASIIDHSSPDDVRILLTDTDQKKYTIYNDLPHLIVPVITDIWKAISSLQWASQEMEDRYRRLIGRGMHNIKGYNNALEPGEEKMSRLVIIIDDLADLMMVSPLETEEAISRLAMIGRAVGIHMVLVTQKPGVLSGKIKVNIPTRIAFSVPSIVESIKIIDCAGAEKLLGRGDMIFVSHNTEKPIRAQGAFISDQDICAIVSREKSRSETACERDAMEKIENYTLCNLVQKENISECDSRLREAVDIVIKAEQASASLLQRRMHVGYARAVRLLDEMEERGIISKSDSKNPCTVLISRQEYYKMFGEE